MKNFFKIALLTFVGFAFSACLKDDPITDYSEESITPIVLIPNGNFPSVSPVNPLALDFKPQAQTIDLYARVSWTRALDKDVTITFVKDAGVIANYNKKFGTTFTELDPAAYKLPALTAVIPAGQREIKISVELFADKVDLSKNNMIAFRLSDASGQPIASNFSQMVFPLLVKNIYEANYKVTGYLFHPSAPRAISATKYISTVTGIRCDAPLGDLGGSGYHFQFDINGSTLSNWESKDACPPAPSAGFMTEDNLAGIGTYPGATTGFVKSTFDNTYNAGTKTFKMHYGYGVGSTGQDGYTRQVYETWVRQ